MVPTTTNSRSFTTNASTFTQASRASATSVPPPNNIVETAVSSNNENSNRNENDSNDAPVAKRTPGLKRIAKKKVPLPAAPTVV